MRAGCRKRSGRREGRVDIRAVTLTGVILGLFGNGAENDTGNGRRCSTAGGVLHVVIVPRSMPSASVVVTDVVVDDIAVWEATAGDVAIEDDEDDTGTLAGVSKNSASSFWSLRRIARSASPFISLARNVLRSPTAGCRRLISRRATSV